MAVPEAGACVRRSAATITPSPDPRKGGIIPIMDDDLIELDLPWHPNGGAPQPHLLASEFEPTRVIYRTAESAPTEESFAVLRFPLCQQLKFGYPNDEALGGHPLYEKGLSAYSIFEVRNSSWNKLLAEYNLAAFPNPLSPERHSRHFIVTFHDSTLECLADCIEGRFASSWQDAFREGDAGFVRA